MLTLIWLMFGFSVGLTFWQDTLLQAVYDSRQGAERCVLSSQLAAENTAGGG